VAARVLAAEMTVVRGQPLVCWLPPTDSAIGAAQTFRDSTVAAGFSELSRCCLAAGLALYSSLHPLYGVHVAVAPSTE
jgi:hypothetical protein